MEESILEWANHRFTQPSRRNFHPNQGWMRDKKIKHGAYTEWQEPVKPFIKKVHVHIVSQMNSVETFTNKNYFIYPAKYVGLPNQEGFRIILNESVHNLRLYHPLVGKYVSMWYNVPIFTVPEQKMAKEIIKDFAKQYCELHEMITDDIFIDF